MRLMSASKNRAKALLKKYPNARTFKGKDDTIIIVVVVNGVIIIIVVAD